MSIDSLRESVRAERVAQGLPPTVTDPAVLARVAAVLQQEAVAA